MIRMVAGTAALSLLAGCGNEGTEATGDGGEADERGQAKLLLEYLERPVSNPSAGYEFVGVESCRTCHAQEFADWSESHHAVAMQHATEETVLGDFENVEFEHFGRMTRFYRKDGEFWVNTENGEGKRQDYKVAFTFGVEPLQQYLLPFPGGRLQALNICWDTRPAEQGGQRWFHLYPDEEIPPDDVLHWTRRHFNWNYMCADCHSTNLAKNYDPEANVYETTWSEINVSCEACHGPGSRHVDWAEGRAPDVEDLGLLVRLKESEPATWLQDPKTGKPVRSHPLEHRAQLETCAPCHAHRQILQQQRYFGQHFTDGYVPTALDRVHYHADGQIKEEVYVFGSYVQSKMYHQGVRCTDCHHPHTMQLYADDNNLCNRCHLPSQYDTPEHHFHPPGSTGASCVECHMPAKYYMVVDKRRDHSIRIPRPDLSRQYGTPNACTRCHQGEGEDDAWAAAAFEEWWGSKPRPSYGEILAKGRRDVRVWQDELMRLARNSAYPAIARASAVQLLGEDLTLDSLEAVKEALEDPDPLVRRYAVTALESVPASQRLALGADRLRDVSRAVRVEAARVLAAVDRDSFSPEDREAFEFAAEEFVDSQMAVADVPEGRLSLAMFYLNQGDRERSEEQYLAALRLEPGNVPARVNLADLYYQTGRFEEAGELLEEGVQRNPENGFAQEALGRHFIRAKAYEKGLQHIRKAVELQPERPELHYLLGVGYNSMGQYQEALPFLQKAVELDPDNIEYVLGAAAICRDGGDFRMALRFVENGLERAPQTPDLLRLRQELVMRLQQTR